jgi:serine/threonine protein kinase/tetratricopeptide (TPR) repeat protein
MPESDVTLLPSTLVTGNDRFEILETIGAGALSSVYRAHDRLTHRNVALKVPHPHLGAVRVSNETLLARRISHPNVVRIYDLHPDGISMELLEGGTLATLASSGELLPIGRFLEIATALASGLAEAHRLDVVHADLKPANILLDGRGNAKISDFGLASSGSIIWDLPGARGTIDYMAPEQLKGSIPDKRSDCYSLALILCELLIGSPNRPDRRLILDLAQRVRRRTFPLSFWKMLRAGLAEDPDRRPTAVEMLDVLEAQSSDLYSRHLSSILGVQRRVLLLSLIAIILFGSFLEIRHHLKNRSHGPLVLLPIQNDHKFESLVFMDALRYSLLAGSSSERPLWFPANSSNTPSLDGLGPRPDVLVGSVKFENGTLSYDIEVESGINPKHFRSQAALGRATIDAQLIAGRVLGTTSATLNCGGSEISYYRALTTLKHYPGNVERLLAAVSDVENTSVCRELPQVIALKVELYRAVHSVTHDRTWEVKAFELLTEQGDVTADPDLALAAARANLARENEVEASRIIEEALRRHPHSVRLLPLAGQLELRRGALTEAIVHLQELARRNPLDASTFTMFGMAYLGVPDASKAILELEAAARLDPSPKTWSNLGAAYLYNGEYSLAEPLLERALEQAPDGGAESCNLGLTLWGLDRRDLALSVLERSVRQTPSELTIGCLAHLYRWSGQVAAAEKEFNEAAHLARIALSAKNDPALRGRLATYEAGLGSDKAIDDIRAARELRLSDLDLTIKNAVVYEMLHKTQPAAALVDEIIRRGGRRIVANHPDLSKVYSRSLLTEARERDKDETAKAHRKGE